MLQVLKIENLALIEKASLEFESGLVAITGETGAGKSILLGAMGMLAGYRIQKSVIKEGAEACRVEGLIQLPPDSPVHRFLNENDLPPAEEGVLLLKRSVHREKPSRVEINGSLSTVQQLQALGELWLDIHGPSEPQRLFQEKEQLTVLDAFARAGSTFAEYHSAYSQWLEEDRAIRRLQQERQLTSDEAAYLRDQVEKIDALNLTSERLDQLEQDMRRVDRLEDIQESGRGTLTALGDEEGAQHFLATALQHLESWARHDPTARDLKARLEGATIEIADIASELETLLGSLEWDEDQLSEMRETMGAWLELKRRHGGTLEGVLQYRDTSAERLAEQSDLAGTLHRREQARDKFLTQARTAGEKLHHLRTEAARKLEKEVSAILLKLGFRKAGFQLQLKLVDDLLPSGISSLEMCFSPNAGQSLLPLRQIASSGEMARVMLALKASLAKVDATPVLVFDEVDANVGGEVGRTVGRELAGLASGHQVFCVTHLPQVASLANSHWVVVKDQDETTTSVRMESLHGKKSQSRREAEIARMLGDRDSAAALQMARSLLQSG
jgi:DNA repair protein RecN (Recombination protein N)